MRIPYFLTMLMLTASLAGCLGDDGPDYSDFDGCTDDDLGEECSLGTPDENETVNETTTEIGTYENQTVPLIEGLARSMNGEWTN